MTPSPALLDRMSRARFAPRLVAGSVGSGERRSRAKGAGIEFEDHRAYQPGDDLRHLDPHLYARLGESYIRRFAVHQQLPVTIILDASRSMAAGGAERWDFATGLTSLLAFVGLAGGDQVRLGIGRAGMMEWSSRYHGVSRAPAVFDWILRKREHGGSFAGCLVSAARDISDRGLTIVVSDMWDLPERDIGALAAANQEVWLMHVLAQEEVDPDLLGTGETRFIDAETGEEIELNIDRTALERFRREVGSWREQLRRDCEAVKGRYVPVPVGSNLDILFLKEWRKLGLIA